MKRLVILLLSLLLLLGTATAESATASLQEMYAQAELLMVQGDYAGAAAKFEALSAYSDAAQMTLYCKAIYAADMGMYVMAVDALSSMGQFKDASQLARYYTACSFLNYAETNNPLQMVDYEKYMQLWSDDLVKNFKDPSYEIVPWNLVCCYWAKAIFTELALYKDSLMKISECDTLILKLKEANAAQEEAEREKKYQDALEKENTKNYQAAADLYFLLEDYKDSKSRYAVCIAEIEKAKELEKEETYQKALNLEKTHDYHNAISVYETLLGYKDSAARIQTCSMRIDYWNALLAETRGDYSSAMFRFNELGEYRNSIEQAMVCQRAQDLTPFVFKPNQDQGKLYNYLSKQKDEFSILSSHGLSDYLVGQWIIHYVGDKNNHVCHSSGNHITEIGRVLEDGSYRLSLDYWSNYHDFDYSVEADGILTMANKKYQIRKVTDFLYAAYSEGSSGVYSEPAYIANRVTITNNGNGFVNVYSETQSQKARYAATRQVPLTFASKDNDTIENWYASNDNIVKLCAALLVETGSYVEFMDYGDLENTYMTLYNGTMNSILIGMKDYSILYHYIPADNVLMCQYIDGLNLSESYVSDLFKSWGCTDYKKIPAIEWLNLFEESGKTEESVMSYWKNQ